MARPANQPTPYDFRQGSTDRSVLHMIEGLTFYGLLKDWSRTIGEDDKPTYRLVFPDGTSEYGLKPNEAKWMLQGMINAHRIHTNLSARYQSNQTAAPKEA